MNIARELLLKLLVQVDRGGRESLPISERSAKGYFQQSDLDSRESIHATLESAEKAGCIALDWGKGAAAQDLKRIRLKDADELASYLNVSRAFTKAELMVKHLAGIIDESPNWLVDAYKKAGINWQAGSHWQGISNSENEEASILFRIGLAVSRNEQIGQDLRRFSIKLLGDSKGIEKRSKRVANLLRCNPEWSEFQDNQELFRLLGLEKFPPPLLIKGPLEIMYSSTNWDISHLKPFVGLSPDQVDEFKLISNAPYLLTIENLASFQRHAREVDDDGIIVYTAGFPSPSLVNILKVLDLYLPENCQFFHWGDQDLGGLRIFSKLESAYTMHELKPHLMTEIEEQTQPLIGENRQKIKRYVSEENQAGLLAESWLQTKHLGFLEQEATDPKPPI